MRESRDQDRSNLVPKLQALQRGGAQQPARESTTLSDTGLASEQRGYLRCLLHMGQLKSQLTQVNGWALTASGGTSSVGSLEEDTRSF